MLRTRKAVLVLAFAAIALVAAGCQEADVEKALGNVYQRVEAGQGWAVLTEATDGVRELLYVTLAGDTVRPLGSAQTVTGAAEADLKVEKGLVVVETKKDGAPQYTAFRYGAAGLEPVDYYTLYAPEPAQKTGHTVYVNKRLNALWHFADGRLVKVYRVATGRQTQPPVPTWQDYRTNFFTPEGIFEITDFKRNPPYNALKAGDRSFSGGAPGNPLGTRWMGFSVLAGDGAGIWGIHGTAEPEKIGTWASDGCIRMYTEQAEELFEGLRGHRVTVQIVAN
ncbi:MAG TPA: L,D-transpeptidase [Symbiobacteriaceae bacterium]|nr:L,D-transpeptidase [Symbiobacteriaceae bacterium]